MAKINTPTFLSNHKGGEYVFLVYRITDIGGGFSFQCMGSGEVNVLVYGKQGGGWGQYENLHLNAGQGLRVQLVSSKRAKLAKQISL